MRSTIFHSERGASVIETVILVSLILLSSFALKAFSQRLAKKAETASCAISYTANCKGGGTIGISGRVPEPTDIEQADLE